MPTPDHSPSRPRRPCTVRVFRLGQEPADDLSSLTTAEQRLAMVTLLTHRMWELTGRPVPSYQRASMPGRVLRPT
jgi:hypothetical protein